MIMSSQKFWVENPCELFSNFNVVPQNDMSVNEKLNTIARLVIVISGVLYIIQRTTDSKKHNYNAMYILIGGLALTVAFKYMDTRQRENFASAASEERALANGVRSFDPSYDSFPQGPPNNMCWGADANTGILNAAYEITPNIQFNHYDDSKRSYMNAKYELNPLEQAEDFTQIWRNEPEWCGGYTMIPDERAEFPVEPEYEQGQPNYIVRSTVDTVPGIGDQAFTNLHSIRAQAEAQFAESTMKFREGIMNEHIDRFRRERQHNCPGMKLSTGTAGAGGSI